MKDNQKFFGILMPLFSLPSPHGVGTLGKDAFRFVDFLFASGAKVWQMLPLNVTSYGDSPYQSPSSNGLSYYYIDLDLLKEEGLLKKEDIHDELYGTDPQHVNYEYLFYHRLGTLRTAFSRFNKQNQSFRKFVREGTYNDFAFYMVLKEKNHYRPWYEWDGEERNYTPELELKVKKAYKNDYLFYVWTQFEFLKQYKALKKYANRKGIEIMGDMPIYVAYDSVEAYKYPELFAFNEDHSPKTVAGVPPDAFSDLGQLWGNPIYDWDYQRSTGYAWFNRRIEENLKIFDILRIDHFRGFSAFYEIPYGREDAKIGWWHDGPAFDLFQDKTDLPIVAENLGVIDQGVIDLMNQTGYPGMEVVLFGINNESEEDSNKPWNASFNAIAYTGTHDNETVMGTLKGLNEEQFSVYQKVVRRCCEFLKIPYRDGTLDELTDTINRLAMAYPCLGTIIPLQDLLHLDNSARINRPSVLTNENWVYRASKKDFSKKLANSIRHLVIASGRS